jgi:hypothetical protein
VKRIEPCSYFAAAAVAGVELVRLKNRCRPSLKLSSTPGSRQWKHRILRSAVAHFLGQGHLAVPTSDSVRFVITEVHTKTTVGRAGLDFVVGVILPDYQAQLWRRLQIPDIGVLCKGARAYAANGDDYIATSQTKRAHQIVLPIYRHTVGWLRMKIGAESISIGRQ